MLAHNAFFLNRTEIADNDARLKRLFADDGVREFLHVHQSEGIEWFNRERFEELVKALYLTGLCTLLTKDTLSAEIISETIRILNEVQEYCDKAEKSGYRTQQFLHTTK
jgi:hypothetical protein